jgi:hypothetical protein
MKVETGAQTLHIHLDMNPIDQKDFSVKPFYPMEAY